MKNIIKIIFISLCTISAVSLVAKEKTKKIMTEKFKVSGACGMCEKRIEKAALIKGVKMADWNKQTQELKVVYSTKKTTKTAIQKAIVAVGHDTGDFVASNEVYTNLPECCQYRTVEVH